MRIFRIHDDNTLEDILGSLYVAQIDKSVKQVDQLIARIEAKLAKDKNRIRRNWFSTALDLARQSRDSFAAGQSEQGRNLLGQTEDYLVSGNKAHRRKTAFVVAPDGTAHPVGKEAEEENGRTRSTQDGVT
jgi:hypothetical protein